MKKGTLKLFRKGSEIGRKVERIFESAAFDSRSDGA